MEELQQQLKESEAKEADLKKKLATITIDKTDVTLLADEFDITASIAERVLRENDGNFKKAAMTLIAA